MKIEMGKKYSSNGKPIRILCIDRPNDSIYPVIGIHNNGSVVYFEEDGKSPSGTTHNLIEVWQPQEGEWCWFWNNEESKSVVLDRFTGMNKFGLFKGGGYSSWQYCAKFDGTIPEHLKLKIKEIK
jgi:hypothetical protein